MLRNSQQKPQCTACRTTGRLDCDGGLPSCGACATTGRKSACSYGVQIGWAGNSTWGLEQERGEPNALVLSNQAVAQILSPVRLLPDATTFELQSISHFIRAVSPTLVALEVPDNNPNYSYLPIALGAQSKALYHGLVASGSAHALNWGLDVEPRLIRKHEMLARELLEQDMRDLAKSMRDGNTNEAILRDKVNSLLAVLQTLVLYGTTIGDTKVWRKHLKDSAALIAHVTKIYPGLRIDTFVLETIRFLDVQTALSLNCGTTISRSVTESGWTPSQTVVHSSITGMHGFSGDYLSIVSRMVDLSKAIHDQYAQATSIFDPLSSPSHDASPNPNLITPDILHQTIESIFTDLEQCHDRIQGLERDPAFRTALLRRLSLGNHAEKLDGHFRFADTIYYACHVYLARTLTAEYRLPEENQHWVLSGLEALSQVPWEGPAGNMLGWALVVIGSELENDEAARGIVRLRLKALGELGHLNLKQTAILLEEVWRQKDERAASGGGGLALTWQGTLKSMGWDLMVA